MKTIKPKAIIFDLFGVLCNSFNSKWQKDHLTEGTEQYKKFAELSDEIDLGKKFQADYYILAGETINKLPEEIKHEMESGFTPNKQMFDIVQSLRKKYILALGSNSGATFVRAMLKQVGYPVENVFDHIFISSEIGLLKPDPEFFKLCARTIGLQPQDCVFIDDSAANVSSAESIGMIGYTYSDTQSFMTWLKDCNIITHP